MWRLQGGSYIPGFSGQAYGAGLQRDVIKTRKDQAKKARALRKYMNKRGVMGRWGGRLASGLLGAALGSTMGPVGLMIAKAGGAGLGSLLGGSKMLSGKGPNVGAGSDGTGLLGSGYEQLSEAKGGIDEAMRGQALGAGVSQLASGLAGAAGDKLGEAFKQTRAGVRMGELQSGYGKMMAGKGINIGEALPEAEQVTDLEGTGLAGGFDWGEAPSNKLTKDLSWFDKAPGFYGVQQGGYMQGYQEGGPTDMEMMRHTESLREKYGLEKPEVSDWQQSASEKKYGALKSSEESERESSRLRALAELGGMGHAESAREAEDIYQQSLGDMDRGNLKSLLGLVGGAKDDIEMGPWNPTNTGKMRTLSQAFSGPEDKGYKIGMHTPDIRGDIDVESTMARRNYPSPLSEITLPGYDNSRSEMMKLLGMQMGGMMPGGVSNALPYHRGGSVHPYYDWSDDVEFDEDMQTGGYLSRYNLGGSVTQQPMAYQLGGLLKYRRSPMMG